MKFANINKYNKKKKNKIFLLLIKKKLLSRSLYLKY